MQLARNVSQILRVATFLLPFTVLKQPEITFHIVVKVNRRVATFLLPFTVLKLLLPVKLLTEFLVLVATFLLPFTVLKLDHFEIVIVDKLFSCRDFSLTVYGVRENKNHFSIPGSDFLY